MFLYAYSPIFKMNILITGGSGFIAVNLIQKLLEKNINIITLFYIIMNIEITEANEDILELQNNYLHLQNSPPHPPNDNNINQIMINSDCFEYFDKIPSNSVDLILTDPPYNSTHNDFDKNDVDLDYLWYNYIRDCLHACMPACLSTV